MSAPDQTEDMIVDALTREAALWIERRDFGGWSEEDRREFESWIVQSPSHRVAFIRLDTGWKRSELLSALQTFKPQRFAEPQRRRWWAITGAAAAVVALAAYGISGVYFQKPKTQTYATTIGGRETLALADGSEIELNTDTSLRISNEAGMRKAWLDKGEAYFKIKHDAAHPFVVIAGAHRITDLGTRFTVRDEAGGIRVALMEGRARLDAGGAKTGPRSVTLTPGDVALATATSLSVNKKPASQLARDVGWEHGVLTFDHLALADAARELNRYNTRKLIIADAAAGRLTMGGTFATNDVDAIANVAHEIFGLHVENQGNNIVISR